MKPCLLSARWKSEAPNPGVTDGGEIGEAWEARAGPVVQAQLRAAGLDLAGLLNGAFP